MRGAWRVARGVCGAACGVWRMLGASPRLARPHTPAPPPAAGAARAVGLVLPELKGKLDGSAIRVPTANVSVVDLKFVPQRDTTAAEVNELLTTAAHGRLNGILDVTDKPLVSIDFNHDPHSSIVALDQTMVTADGLVRVLSWYDNEWGFSNRMLDMAAYLASH